MEHTTVSIPQNTIRMDERRPIGPENNNPEVLLPRHYEPNMDVLEDTTGAARVISQTISVESNVPKSQKVIAGKEPGSAGPKSAGLKPAGLKTAAGRPTRPTVGGKAPRKQAVPRKRKSRPGSGLLNFVPTTRDFLEAQVVGDTLPAANKTTKDIDLDVLLYKKSDTTKNVPTF